MDSDDAGKQVEIKYHGSEAIPWLKTISKSRQNLSLPEKEKKNGSNCFGDKEFAFEETKGYHRDHEEADDQYNQKISNQSVFDGRDNHRAAFFKNPLISDHNLLRRIFFFYQIF